MKKILSLILAFVMLLSLSTTAFATDVCGEIEAIADTSPISSGEAIYLDADTEEGELLTFDEVAIPVQTGSGNSRGIEIYIVRAGIKSSASGQFKWYFNVDCPTSPFVKPNIKLTAQLKGSFTTLTGSYTSIGSSVYHNYTTNTEYGVDYTWNAPAKTGYYYVSYTIIDYDNACSGSGVTTTGLTNRTGHEWVYSFSDTGKTLPMPRADWTKGATHQRPNNLADTYYTTYTQMTGKTLIRSLYDVHHIQPLSYGGDNSYSNLIHLPKALHSQVTGWFNGY